MLAELTSKLADAKLEAAGLKEQLARMKEENQKLSDLVKKRSTDVPMLVGNVYKFDGELGSFCTGCYESGGKKIRLTSMAGFFGHIGAWKCPVCKATYQ